VVGAGEIVGVAGVEAAGSEAADVLSSLTKLDEHGRGGRCGRADGPARNGRGRGGGHPRGPPRLQLRARMTVAENLAMADRAVARHRMLDRRALRQRAAADVEFEIPRPGRHADAPSVGRQQQRVVLAASCRLRRSCWSPRNDPWPRRRRHRVHGARLRAAESGVGVLLISNELEEILAAHRIVVVTGGGGGRDNRAEADLERIGLLMGGAAA
jgi:ABC-type uncharacterized transport system ATPase subunit